MQMYFLAICAALLAAAVNGHGAEITIEADKLADVVMESKLKKEMQSIDSLDLRILGVQFPAKFCVLGDQEDPYSWSGSELYNDAWLFPRTSSRFYEMLGGYWSLSLIENADDKSKSRIRVSFFETNLAIPYGVKERTCIETKDAKVTARKMFVECSRLHRAPAGTQCKVIAIEPR